MLLKLGRCHNGIRGLSQRENFILRGIIVPLAHNFFSLGVMNRGEGLVGELAHQVLCAVDFKWVELEIVGGHCVALMIAAFNVLFGLFYCVSLNQFFILSFCIIA